MTDEKIVELYLKRDESAIKETENKYQNYLYKIAYNILSDSEDSLESVNDTYLAAWNSIPPQKPSALSVYLAKLTRRISISMLRKSTAKKRGDSQYALSLCEFEETLSFHTTPETELEEKLLANALNVFLKTLSDDARNLFIGRYYFLDPLKTVAKYCNMSESKAKTLLYRTRCALRGYLEKEGFEI